MILNPSGCPSRPTVPSSGGRAWSLAPRTCITSPRRPKIMDATAGLWCCNAGHARRPIVEAIQKQADELDFAPTFQFGHPKVFALAARIAAMAPKGSRPCVFLRLGFGSGDTALKIALAYYNVSGEGSQNPPDRTRARLSRGRLRRHFGRRHRAEPQIFRLAARPASIICPRPMTGTSRLSPRASRNMARISPMSWSASSRCMMPAPSPPSSSSRWPVQPACCRRPRAICKSCARSATSTAFC